MFDLQLLPITATSQPIATDLPGFLASNAPRRAGRGRSDDQLITLLTRKGRPSTAEGELRQSLESFAQVYFKTSGPVTAALRAAVETLSKDLLARSRRPASPENTGGYLLNIAVVHGSMLYLAHCGPVHSVFTSQGEARHFADTGADSRGFGLGQGAALRFFQSELHPGDGLLVAPEAPEAWFGLDLARLLRETPAQIRAVLAAQPAAQPAVYIRFQTGTGKIEPLAPTAPSVERPAAAPAMTSKPAVVAAYPTVFDAPAGGDEDLPLAAEPELISAAAPPWEQTAPAAVSARPVIEAPRLRPEPAAPPRPETAAPAQPRASRAPRIQRVSLPVLRTLSRWLHGGEHLQTASGGALKRFFSRLLPGQSDQPTSLSPVTMAFVAVAVPLVVVTLALAVYFERGKEKIFQTYFSQAVQAAALTQNQADPAILRSAWAESLYWLDKAEASQTTGDSQALRGQAQQALDALDSIARLDFQPAIVGGLAQGVNVTDIVASPTDIYLLNSAQGRVQRAILTGRGFEVDPEFICEPGPSGSYIIGELLDIAPMPKGNEFKATVMAIDGAGNLMFCGPGVTPTSIPLGAPDTGWGKIEAIAYINNALYVLDPLNNAVWVYDGVSAFRDRPRMFFGSQIPPMSAGIDLTSNGDDLYVLHADGHMTLCTTTYGSQSEPRCTDPAPLTDPRPGWEKNASVLPDTQFSQIQYTQPPDPSLYLLNPADASIYHFSLRLNLQRQMRSFPAEANPFPDQPATAFAVASNRMVFIAFGSQVFYAIAP